MDKVEDADTIDFIYHQAGSKEEEEDEDITTIKEARIEDPKGNEEAILIEQFRRIFAPILDDSLQLYFQLNDSDDGDAEHVRIHQTVAKLEGDEVTSSEEETTQVTPINSPPVELLLPESDTSTASSSLYAIHTPSPAHPSGLILMPQNLEMLSCGSDEPTLTEQIVQLHAPPQELLNIEDENNTSCSLSSNLTDSKTLDGRTPIVV
ncbi:hypothetical protein KR018_000134 [Drosophila ironensis]|nr:hypothetical protein KR018_000134 [Drosophila ironensis]